MIKAETFKCLDSIKHSNSKNERLETPPAKMNDINAIESGVFFIFNTIQKMIAKVIAKKEITIERKEINNLPLMLNGRVIVNQFTEMGVIRAIIHMLKLGA